MRALLEVVLLELKALSRSRTAILLLVASVLWMLVLPRLIVGDGTFAGARELYVRYSLGGVFALTLISLLASACGSVARERTEKRLMLTLVRPVRHTLVALGKIAAHVFLGAIVLGVSSVVLALKDDVSRPCSHVLSPLMPSPAEEAERMYEEYMKSPRTPEAIRKAKKAEVIKLLEQRAIDRYDTIATNETAVWTFSSGGERVRMRFTNQFEMRQEIRGVFASGENQLSVSNQTQSVAVFDFRSNGELKFTNRGKSSLMLRPRRDLNILSRADSFGWNLLRAYLQLVAVLSMVLSFGVLLSCGLGRPVALFTAFAMLLVAEMGPSVVEQYPSSMDMSRADRVGLAITKTAAAVTRPVSALSPLEALSKDECIEFTPLVLTMALDLVLLPILLSLLSSLVLVRKVEGRG